MTNPLAGNGSVRQSQVSAYFSHSWGALNLPINLMLWQALAADCHLLIDQPDPVAEPSQPYFISRIESVMRQADVFVGCVPRLPVEKQRPAVREAVGDWRFHLCSPFILFELRLAERGDLPRFVLYDRASRFQPPAMTSPHVRYVGRDFQELQALIEGGGQDQSLVQELEQWLGWVTTNYTPRRTTPSGRAAYLLGDTAGAAELRSAVIEAVDTGGFERPQALDHVFHTDAELYVNLRSLGLLVVDVGRPELWPLYHAAHSLMVPTVRVHSGFNSDPGATDCALPLLLRGHPAGYQKDLLPGATAEPIFERLQDRAKAVARGVRPVLGLQPGRRLLYARTFPGSHYVFISHDERLDNRALVDAVVRRCEEHGIVCWEYAVENRSGEVWRRNMDAALAKATHVLALLSPGYEQSTGCREEWAFALEHRLRLLPFLTHGRTKPSVELRGEKIAHEHLPPALGPEEAAARIVATLENTLRNPAPTAV